MPEMNGFELARRIYEIDKDIKIVIINAFDQVTTKEELEKVVPSTKVVVVVAFIRKPFEIAKLIDYLDVLLNIKSRKDHHWFIGSSLFIFMINVIGTIMLTL